MKEESAHDPNVMMKEFNPLPREGRPTRKFDYFYEPYNYQVNTQKHMKFEEEPPPEVCEEHRILSQKWRNIKLTPWTQNRPESEAVFQRAYQKH